MIAGQFFIGHLLEVLAMERLFDSAVTMPPYF
jgi:hypothetical protein